MEWVTGETLAMFIFMDTKLLKNLIKNNKLMFGDHWELWVQWICHFVRTLFAVHIYQNKFVESKPISGIFSLLSARWWTTNIFSVFHEKYLYQRFDLFKLHQIRRFWQHITNDPNSWSTLDLYIRVRSVVIRASLQRYYVHIEAFRRKHYE